MSLKNFFFWRRNNVPGKPFIDRKYIEDTLAVSPVPIVLICVLVWAVSSVLLLLSENQQRDLTVWVDGQRAPFSVWARTDFSYEDTAATEKLRQAAADKALRAYRIDRNREDRIAGEIKMFFNVLGIERAAEDINNKPGVLQAEKLLYRQEIAGKVKEQHPQLLQKLRDIASFYGAEYSQVGDYPAWEYREESPLRDVMVKTYEKITGKQPQVIAIHAGLECGLLGEKIPGLDCVSIGPQMYDIHTSRERLDITSTDRTWKFLLEILKNL
jgi:hypothetical protein